MRCLIRRYVMEEQRKTSNTTITEDDINEVSHIYHLYSIFEVEKCVALKKSASLHWKKPYKVVLELVTLKKPWEGNTLEW